MSPKSATQTASLRHGLYVVAVLLLPLLVLWHRDNVLYSPPLCTDPWFYLGYFKDLVDFKRDLFPSFHGGSRYSWILPGYLVHSLFSSPGHRRCARRLPDGNGLFSPPLVLGRNRVGLH